MCAHASRPGAPRFGFPRARRLRRPAEFRQAYATGRRLGHGPFTVVARANGLDRPRLGLSIAARIVRRAVERNRLRRLIRESFRLHQALLPPLDLVIGVRAGAAQSDGARLHAALEELWSLICSKCASIVA